MTTKTAFVSLLNKEQKTYEKNTDDALPDVVDVFSTGSKQAMGQWQVKGIG
jgi:hypothetical protein